MSRIGSGKGTIFGAGIYFAESAMKADEYTKPDARGYLPLILNRVMLGNINYCDTDNPWDIKHDLEDSCKPGKGDNHSVLGDREVVRKTFREFIIYDNEQCYPEYIVWYKRRL